MCIGCIILLGFLICPIEKASNTIGNENEKLVQQPKDTVPILAYSPPVPFDPNQNFQFSTFERCGRYFYWSSWNTTGVTFDTPSSFNSTLANVSFRVCNTTIETLTIIDQSGSDGFTSPQAQGFELSTGVFLQGFSVYVYGRPNADTFNWSIRADSPGGPILSQVPVTLPVSVNEWYYVGLTSPLFITAGHYYVNAPALGNPSRSKWMRTGMGATGDCYAYSGSWQQQDRNLTLKLDVKNLIDPESVGMNISDTFTTQPILNLGDGTGWANISSPITGNTISYSISNSSPIEYSFSGDLTSFRYAKAQIAVNLTNGQANWTLNAFAYPGLSYSVYQGNITGFNPDDTSIQAFHSQDSIGYSRPPPYDTLIFDTAVDTITFLSANYITSAEIPSEVHSNQDVALNVTVGDIGNVCLTIFDNSGSVYNNESYASGTNKFHWHVDTTLAAGAYTFEATFFTPNNVGFLRQNITIVKVATIGIYNLQVQTLDLIQLNFRYFDLYSGTTIDGASINYYFGDLTGSLQQDITGNYTKSLDLGTYSIPPGSYLLYLISEKAGYQSLLVSTPVDIVRREIGLEVERSTTNLYPGSSLDLSVTPRDPRSGGNLLRPVDITIKIYPTGGNSDLDAIVTEIIKSTTSLKVQSIPIPSTVPPGAYDILVRVESNLYSGSLVISRGLIVDQPLNVFISVFLVLGIVMAGSGSYVQRKKLQSRRSVKGAFIMNPGGNIIEQRISPRFSMMNPHLISGAVMGIVTMVKEMTGKPIHTIALEGRYLKFILRNNFWVVLLMEKNPAWISSTIQKFVKEIEQKFGTAIKEWKGEVNLDIPLDDLLWHWFGVEIKVARDPALELVSREDTVENPKHKE